MYIFSKLFFFVFRNVRNIAQLNENDLKNGIFDHNLTWHSQYKDSAYIFIGEFFVGFFVSAIWRLQDQLSASCKGTASFTRCLSFTSTLVHLEPCKEVGSLSWAEHSVVLTGNAFQLRI